jgi:hypothetical protein
MGSKRETIPYGVDTGKRRDRSGSRRRMLATCDTIPAPMVSPLPGPEGETHASTAVTQPMPTVAPTEPVVPPPAASRPAIPPPRMPESVPAKPPSSKPTDGVYRFTAPSSERRKKR